MAFENATVTKGLMLGIAFTSIAVGIFDIKHYANLQLSPHLSRYHQYWRLFTYHLACVNSSDLLLIELLLYNVGVQIERSFGSVKYASFLAVSTLVSTIITFLCLLIFQISRVTGNMFNNLHSGPISLIFSIMYQYVRLVPQAYQLKVFGAVFSDKIWVYVIAGQLAISWLPASLVPTLIGLLTGFIYRSDMLQLKSWRIPHRLQVFAETYLQLLLGEGRIMRRSNRVFPDARLSNRANQPSTSDADVVTTAPLRRSRMHPQERTGNRRQSDIRALMVMFPDVGQEAITDVVQRSPNIEAAVAVLLSSQT